MNVPLPQAKNLVEISNSILTIGCAVEFENYLMIALEGQRAFRMVPNYHKHEEIIDHKNVIWVELTQRMSAFDFCEVINTYGDVYVIKDGASQYFVEFQWVDDRKNPECKRSQDIVTKIMKDQPFG